MKAYTSLEQSKKLAEILPLESADMAWYSSYAKDGYSIRMLNDAYPLDIIGEAHDDIPCWSLAALLDILPSGKALVHVKGMGFGYKCICKDIDTVFYNNSVDACVEMIIKLHEIKLL